METTINDFDASCDEVNPKFNNDNTNDESYFTSDDSTVKGDHDVNEDDPTIHEDNLQENYFNVNNDVIAEVNGELEEDDEPINNENEGVDNVYDLVHIENDDDNDDDHMLKEVNINESSKDISDI